MALKKWLELSVELRRSFYKRWNYLAGEVDGLKKWHQLRPHLRKRESDRWNYLAEFVEGLKKWHQLGPHLRKSESDRWDYLVDEIEGSSESTPENNLMKYDFCTDAEGSNSVNHGIVEYTKTSPYDDYSQIKIVYSSDGGGLPVNATYFLENTENDGVYAGYDERSGEGNGLTAMGMYFKLSPIGEQGLESRNITFYVKDLAGRVQGATVTLGDKTGTTAGSVGGCSLSDVADGIHTVTVEKEGYITKTVTIFVSESDTTFNISIDSE